MNGDFDELKELIKNYKAEDIEYGKSLKYLLFRNNVTQKEIEKEILEHKDLRFIEKQFRKRETRYWLFFVYSKKRGRVYVVKFGEKLRVVTIHPLGRKSLRRYLKKFKNLK